MHHTLTIHTTYIFTAVIKLVYIGVIVAGGADITAFNCWIKYLSKPPFITLKGKEAND